jgi:hypothetical protein
VEGQIQYPTGGTLNVPLVCSQTYISLSKPISLKCNTLLVCSATIEQALKLIEGTGYRRKEQGQVWFIILL